jgi:hypothetical protein
MKRRRIMRRTPFAMARDEAIDQSDRTEERWCIAEELRIRARLF